MSFERVEKPVEENERLGSWRKIPISLKILRAGVLSVMRLQQLSAQAFSVQALCGASALALARRVGVIGSGVIVNGEDTLFFQECHTLWIKGMVEILEMIYLAPFYWWQRRRGFSSNLKSN
jgi:hypothetical protein